MSNSISTEIGKILLRLSVLSNETKALRLEKQAILHQINHSRLQPLYQELSSIKNEFDRYRENSIRTQHLQEQLTVATEIRKLILERIYHQDAIARQTA